MAFPQVNLNDEADCFTKLVELFHPNGLSCPRCGACDGLRVHRKRRIPVVDFRCSNCGRVFNTWTQTPFENTHHNPLELMKILWAIYHGVPTAQLSRDLHCHRGALLALRRRLQRRCFELFGRPSRPQVPDAQTPSDQACPLP